MSGGPLVDLSGARVTVMGLGLFGGGVAAARFALDRGAHVTVTDLRDPQTLDSALKQLRGAHLEFVLGEHRESDFTAADLIIANPAVPPSSRFLRMARAAGVRVTSEIALFLDEVNAPVVAVSGTQGKSSTAHLLAQLLGCEGGRVFLGGNIGRPLLGELNQIGPGDVVALELSSYQLEDLRRQWNRLPGDSPIRVAGLTNVLSDHLERHGTRAEYARAKLELFETLHDGGHALLRQEPLPVEWHARADLKVVRTGGPILRIEAGEFLYRETCLGQVHESPFQAGFQLQNLLLALGLAFLSGVRPEALAAAISGLRGLPHRLDPVGDLDGRPLWDNMVSTTPDSTVSALEALPQGQVVLLGGRIKGLDLAPLIETLRSREAQVVVFGEARESWPASLRVGGVPCREAAGALEALELGRQLEGSGLLLSPACSSFDAYPNFQARATAVLAHADTLGLRRQGTADSAI